MTEYPKNSYAYNNPLAAALSAPFKETFEEVSSNLEAAPGLIFSTMFATATAAVQHHVLVKIPTGEIQPVCGSYFIEANSGSRKTTTLSKFLSPFLEFDAELRAKDKIESKDLEYQIKIWKEKKKALERSFSNRIFKGLEAPREEGELYKELILQQPRPSLFKTSLLNDTTTAAAYQAFRGRRSQSIFNSEGEKFIQDFLVQNLTLLNDAYDGNTLNINRASGESYFIRSPRLTTLIMVQEGVLTKHLKGKGKIAFEAGYWARQKFCVAHGIFGDRSGSAKSLQWLHTDEFNARNLELLRLGKDMEGSLNKILEFSDEAAKMWFAYARENELAMADGQAYSRMRDNAAKSPSYVARLAAVFHSFTGRPGKIDQPSLAEAIAVDRFYKNHHYLKFGQAPKTPEEEGALLLEKWLRNFSEDKPGISEITRQYLLQFGPSSLRKLYHLDRAVKILIDSGKITYQYQGRTVLFRLSQHYFPKSVPYQDASRWKLGGLPASWMRS